MLVDDGHCDDEDDHLCGQGEGGGGGGRGGRGCARKTPNLEDSKSTSMEGKKKRETTHPLVPVVQSFLLLLHLAEDVFLTIINIILICVIIKDPSS